MKWILFFPYTIYAYLKDKRKKEPKDAYTSSILIFSLYLFIYLIFIYPNIINVIGAFFSKISLIINLPVDSKPIKYIGFFILMCFPFLIVRKKQLDNLMYSINERRIFNFLTLLIISLPILMVLFFFLRIIIFN
ncbi:hypothetical protein ACF3NR_01935 [Vaginella massiliensis]|uniref:hypothetical protein n=1 Tax=Vaginella massiliensis TaxID=1816680 RepID=UPI0012B61778|nr:hypothetical protein [Vaginella massiliensis]